MVGKMKSIECGIHGPYPATLLDCPECADSRHEDDDTKSEPDVLERLEAMNFIKGSEHRKTVDVAIAEIERLGRAHEVVVVAYNLAHQEVEVLQAQLREYTDAEPVAWTKVGDSQPSPHARYEVLRRETGPFVATPCYGMHEPWWVPLTCDLYSPGSTAFKMEDEDLWRPWIVAPKGDTEE